MEKITIFTPTYNRAFTLSKLYYSLIEQECYSEFKWLIIDDGSTDNTSNLIDSFLSTSPFKIVYHKKNNSGKMSAFNDALEMLDTDFFLCVDSDDFLKSYSIKKLIEQLSLVYSSPNIAGIIAYKGHNERTPLGNLFPSLETSSLQNLYNNGFSGDSTLIFKSDVISKYKFPIIDGEKFITEAYLYNIIDCKYSYHIYPEVITICTYLDDGYTSNSRSLTKNYPLGWALYYFQKFELSQSLIDKIRLLTKSLSFYFYAKKRNRIDIFKNIPIHFFFVIPIGYFLGKIRKFKYKIS